MDSQLPRGQSAGPSVAAGWADLVKQLPQVSPQRSAGVITESGLNNSLVRAHPSQCGLAPPGRKGSSVLQPALLAVPRHEHQLGTELGVYRISHSELRISPTPPGGLVM